MKEHDIMYEFFWVFIIYLFFRLQTSHETYEMGEALSQYMLCITYPFYMSSKILQILIVESRYTTLKCYNLECFKVAIHFPTGFQVCSNSRLPKYIA